MDPGLAVLNLGYSEGTRELVHTGFFSSPQAGPTGSYLRAFADAVPASWNTLSTTSSIQKGLLGAHLTYELLFKHCMPGAEKIPAVLLT